VSAVARDGGVRDGRMIADGQHLRNADADSLRVLCGMNQNGRQPWPIFWLRRKNARLVGRSLAILEPGKRLLAESAYGLEFYRRDPAFNYAKLPSAKRLEGVYTSLISGWGEGYYHWLMDGLPRLACLSEFPKDTRILVPFHLKKYHSETLKALRLEDRVRPTSEGHLEIDDYFFSAPTAMTGCDNPYAIQYLRHSFLNCGNDRPEIGDRIFLKRRAKTRGFLNEKEIEDFFENEGWDIVDLEELDFSEQVGLFSRVRAVAGLHGGGFTNLLWCRPGCAVLELCADNFLNGCYEGIAAYLDLRHGYLVFPADGASNIRVPVADLSRKVRELIGGN